MRQHVLDVIYIIYINSLLNDEKSPCILTSLCMKILYANINSRGHDIVNLFIREIIWKQLLAKNCCLIYS